MKQRSAKKIRKWKEKFERERELRQEIRAAAPDILRSKFQIYQVSCAAWQYDRE